MTNERMFMICNAIKCVALIAGITIAVIHFGKPSLMWFYLIVLGFGIEYKTGEKGE